MVDSPIRVVELTSSFTRLAGRMLVGLGCEVVLVEPPGGDPGRRDCDGFAFGHWHAGKKSVLDLNSAAGRENLALR